MYYTDAFPARSRPMPGIFAASDYQVDVSRLGNSFYLTYFGARSWMFAGRVRGEQAVRCSHTSAPSDALPGNAIEDYYTANKRFRGSRD